MKEESSNIFRKMIIKEYDFQINNILFEYSIVLYVDNTRMAWCTSDDAHINSLMPYFQNSDKIIDYLKELGIEEKDLIEIEKMSFGYLT